MQVITATTKIELEKHFKIVAGPGAGKTTFLVNHIKYVLQNSSRLKRNKKIACITYTNVGVDTLLNRIEDAKDHLEVSTIHSFLFTHIVKPYLFVISEKYGLDPSKFDSTFEHIFSNGNFRKTDLPKYYIDESEMSKIFWAIDDKNCILKLPNRSNKFHKSLLKYKSFFWEKGIMHYDDILAFAWEIINTNKKVLRVLRAKFPYFFIDEFQDTSPIQTEIIKKIAKKETIIGVIGDPAQSIYGFQGADIQCFINFTLPEINNYKIENNYRSTEQIIKVLKLIRSDLNQESPEKKQGEMPFIIIGDSLRALEYIEQLKIIKDIYSLSFMNPTANAIRNRTPAFDEKISPINEIIQFDSNHDRRKILIRLIKSLEFARLKQFDDSIKEICSVFKEHDNYKGHKTSLKVIKYLLSDYEQIKTCSLWDFYNKVICFKELKISKITKQETIDAYEALSYSKAILSIKLIKDETKHRTIHKAKGDEFENVLVIVKGEKGYKYSEARDLAFLLNSDLDKKENENQRVYYVACSRAQKNLAINIPEISNEAKQKLNDYFKILNV